MRVQHRASCIGACFQIDAAGPAIRGQGGGAYVVLKQLPGGAVKIVDLSLHLLSTALAYAFFVNDQRPNPFRLGIRQTAQHETVDHAEDRGVDTDAEGECKNHGESVGGVLVKLAEGKAEIVEEHADRDSR